MSTDLAFLGLTIALFALSWGFVRFCAALEESA